MREHLDCAVLAVPFKQEDTQNLPGSYLGGRLSIEALQMPAPMDDTHFLREASPLLRRFDACLISVKPSNLPWVRTNLQLARGLLTAPVIALTQGLHAPALNDLFNLGVSDFLGEPLCMQELRARCERALIRNHVRMHNDHGAMSSTQGLTFQKHRPADADKLAEPEMAPMADSTISLFAGLPAAIAAELENYAITLATQGNSCGITLKQAKKQLIAQFEIAYVRASLRRHEGNVAMAARAASKHRRAFWELICKHGIDPSLYRVSPYRVSTRKTPRKLA